MSNIDQISNELLSIDADISTHAVKLQREKGEIVNTMNKAQSAFGDQSAGQGLVSTLYRTLQNINNAESSLQMVRQEIREYIQNLHK